MNEQTYHPFLHNLNEDVDVRHTHTHRGSKGKRTEPRQTENKELKKNQ